MIENLMMDLSCEDRLLLFCVQLSMTAIIQKEIESLSSKSIDWNAFLESTKWHGVAPLVYHNLKKINNGQIIPHKILEDLRSTYRKTLVRNTLIFTELNRILSAFEENNIEVIPLKGAAFTKTVYKDIGLRPMSDLDLLVKKDDLSRITQLVDNLEYKQYKYESFDDLLKKSHEIKYIHTKSKILLEIHWDIISLHHPKRIRFLRSKLINIWWNRATSINSKSQRILSLYPADLVYLLSIHFFKHRFIGPRGGFNSIGSLRQLCDVFNIINYYQHDINWKTFIDESQKIGLHKIVGVTLSIVREIFDQINDHEIEFINYWKPDLIDKKIISYVVKRLFIREDKIAPIPISNLKGQEEKSYFRRVKTLISGIFPHPETLSNRIKKPINSKMFYLNYLIRPFLLTSKYGLIVMDYRRLKEEWILKRWINELD